MAETRYILFLLDEQKYGMQLTKISSIEEVYNVVPIPVGVQYIKGIIHLRNTVIPIYDLKAKFGMYDSSMSSTRQLLIAETHGMSIAFEVDQVLGIIDVPETNIKEMPPVVKNEDTGCLESVLKIDSVTDGNADIVISVNIDKLMSDSEFEDVSVALESPETEED